MAVGKTERQKHPVKVAWKRLMVALRLHRSWEQKAAVNWFTGTVAQRFKWSAAQPPSPFVRKADPILWHYVGDTRDWLEHHTHLTGVGRVSIEIFKAALADGSTRAANATWNQP
jgi:hypothetical protein